MDTGLYKPHIICETKSVFGNRTEIINTQDAEYTYSDVPIVKDFLNDNDIQEMRIISTNIGFVKTFRKQFLQVPLTEQVKSKLSNK